MGAHWLWGTDEPQTSNPTGRTLSNPRKRWRLNARSVLGGELISGRSHNPAKVAALVKGREAFSGLLLQDG